MRVTIDVRKLRDSGVGTYIINLVPRVIEALPEVHFTLMGNADELSRLPSMQGDNVCVVDYRTRPFSLSEQVKLPWIIPKGTSVLWVPFINIPLLYRGKLLVTLHDLNFLAMGQFLSLSQRLYARVIYHAIRHKATHVLCASHFTRDEFMRLIPGKSDNVTAVLLGTPLDSLRPMPAAAKPRSRPYFLFVGNVKRHKNLSRLLQAFRQIADQLPHDLVVVGKQEGFNISDQDVTKELVDLKERVAFTGYIDDETLRAYFAHATAFVFPSLYEGFGFPPLEAMASGCPAIVSNGSSLPEVCGDAALYCDPYSIDDIATQMLKIARDDDLRTKLIDRGKRRAKQMTWDRCVAETVKVIRSQLA